MKYPHKPKTETTYCYCNKCYQHYKKVTQPNNQPERSVEEIVEEFKEMSQTYIKSGWDETNNLAYKHYETNWTQEQIDWLTQTLQAERQRCEEMVEAERDRQKELPWFTDDVAWNAVMGYPEAGVISMQEFIEKFEKEYRVVSWRLLPQFRYEKK